MDTKAFRFNSEAKYQAGGHFKEKPSLSKDLIGQQIEVDDEGGHFLAKFPGIFTGYQNPPLTGNVAISNQAWHNWKNTPFDWWQCQLNFALWCSTAGCGVSSDDHLQSKDPLLASLYGYHVYYTARRIQVELKVALPGDDSYSWYDNTYDDRAYKRLCAEFGISPNTDWRQKVDRGCDGLNSFSTFETPSDTYRMEHHAAGPFFNNNDAIRHNLDIFTAWSTFILDKSTGFTKAGVERLNDSIRTYVWALLGAQGQTRSNILSTGTGFDAQKQFLNNTEDAIASPVDIPSSIERYQKTLQYASTPLDYVFGVGLYLSPSDMSLPVGNTQGYNNEIEIAGGELTIGRNPGINKAIPPQPMPKHEGPVVVPTEVKSPGVTPPEEIAVPSPSTAEAKSQSDAHKEEKTAIIVGGIAIGLLAL